MRKREDLGLQDSRILEASGTNEPTVFINELGCVSREVSSVPLESSDLGLFFFKNLNIDTEDIFIKLMWDANSEEIMKEIK